MSASTSAIETIGLGRDYGSTRALEAPDLIVGSGTLVGLLGPNGAGKTTALLLLATLLKPSSGTARIFGYDIARDRAVIRRRLGLVFQEPEHRWAVDRPGESPVCRRSNGVMAPSHAKRSTKRSHARDPSTGRPSRHVSSRAVGAG